MMAPDTKRHVEIGIGTLAFAALIALGVYIWSQTKKIMGSCWTISGGGINNISPNNVNITLFISIKNISDFTITLNSIDLDIYLNNIFITHVNQNISQTVVSQSSNVVSVNLNFSPEDLLKAGTDTIANIISNKSAVIIKTTGQVSVTAGAVTASDVPVTDEISLQQIQDASKQPSNC